MRDRALIGLMVYSFARIGAALRMSVEDVYTQNRRLWVRLRKGGKRHAMPRHHNLEEYLTAYLDGASLPGDPKGPLFRTIGRGTGRLTRKRTLCDDRPALPPPAVVCSPGSFAANPKSKRVGGAVGQMTL
jgi:integrase